MTKKEGFMQVIEKLSTMEGTEELVEFIQNQIDMLDRRAAQAREADKRKRENDELIKEVAKVLTDDYQTINEIVAQLDIEDVTPAKVSYRLNTLAKEGIAEKGTLQVDKRNVVAYKIASE